MKILIISSKGHWIHGWFTSIADLNIAVKVLRNAGIAVETIEVENSVQLERILGSVSSDTLIWPNAYFVKDGVNPLSIRQLPISLPHL